MWVCIFEALLDCSALNMGVEKVLKQFIYVILLAWDEIYFTARVFI